MRSGDHGEVGVDFEEGFDGVAAFGVFGGDLNCAAAGPAEGGAGEAAVFAGDDF